MKDLLWWSPPANGADEARGTLLSHRWVQAFVFELPPSLRHDELEASLRYKVQATLPVNTENYIFHTQLFRHGKKTCGAAFIASEASKEALPSPARSLRVGVPLVLPKPVVTETLLFVSSPEGLVAHYYEVGLLKTSFAPIDPSDAQLRSRIFSKCPAAEVVALAPDPMFPLPPDLREREAIGAARDKLLDAFPLWAPAPHRRYPQVVSSLFLIAGVTLCALAMMSSWTIREKRNQDWKAWVTKAEAVRSAAPNVQAQNAILLKALGAPVPELFAHLAKVWSRETRIVDLEWKEGKLSLTATSASALASLRKLTQDPWFRELRVGEIRTQKDGSESFTVEGGLSIDS